MKRTTLMTLGLVSGLVLSAGALADDHRKHKEQDVSKLLNEYGFTHIIELEWKSDGNIEAEGFSDDQTMVEVTWDKDGKVKEEEKERGRAGAWGLTPEQLKTAMKHGKSEGIMRFEEIDVNRRGNISMEGYGKDDNEIEISFTVNDL
ncbi:hypothetical protein ACR0ST_04605 [Aliidiomarina sp. Khilg15.8]